MRKLFALLLVAGTFAFAACEEKKSEETAETVDSTATVEEAPVVDTTAAPMMDSTMTDTTKKM